MTILKGVSELEKSGVEETVAELGRSFGSTVQKAIRSEGAQHLRMQVRDVSSRGVQRAAGSVSGYGIPLVVDDPRCEAVCVGNDAQGDAVRWALQQQEMAADCAAVERYAAGLAVDEFAAVWWDNEPDPVVFVLAVTGRADEHAAALRRLIEHPHRLQVVEVKRSERALRAVQDELHGLWRVYPISSIAVDAPAGVVSVWFRREDPDARAALERRFGDAIRVEPGRRIVRF